MIICSRILNALVSAVFWLRKVYLTIVTFGAWSNLGDMCLELGDQVFTLNERLGKTEYRLDELMRILELNMNVVIPGHIEPARLTTFGEGVAIEREGELVADDLKKLQAEKDAEAKRDRDAQLDMIQRGSQELTRGGG